MWRDSILCDVTGWRWEYDEAPPSYVKRDVADDMSDTWVTWRWSTDTWEWRWKYDVASHVTSEIWCGWGTWIISNGWGTWIISKTRRGVCVRVSEALLTYWSLLPCSVEKRPISQEGLRHSDVAFVFVENILCLRYLHVFAKSAHRCQSVWGPLDLLVSFQRNMAKET